MKSQFLVSPQKKPVFLNRSYSCRIERPGIKNRSFDDEGCIEEFHNGDGASEKEILQRVRKILSSGKRPSKKMTDSEAAILIQRRWRKHNWDFETTSRKMAEIILFVRSIAAKTIQRIFRGYQIRKELRLSTKKSILAFWDKSMASPDFADDSVSIDVVGTFSNPPWTVSTQMEYKKILGIYLCQIEAPPGSYVGEFRSNGAVLFPSNCPQIQDSDSKPKSIVRLFRPRKFMEGSSME